MEEVSTNTEDNSIKTRLANLLINRVTLSESLNVVRDACVQRAGQIIDEADEEQMKKIMEDIELFETPPEQTDPSTTAAQNVSGSESVSSQNTSGPSGPTASSQDTSGPDLTPIEM